MKSPTELLGQIVGRGGRPAIVDMTVEQVRSIDPGFCERLEARLARSDSCGPYLHRTVGQLAEAEHLSMTSLLDAATQGKPASSVRHANEGHRLWPGPRLTVTVSDLHLEREIEELHAEPAWQEFDRNAKTLIKRPELRIVLMVLKAGARLEEHAAPGAISVQVLAGRARVRLPSGSVELQAGELVGISAGVRHDLEALEPSSVLLTITGPHRDETVAPGPGKEARSADTGSTSSDGAVIRRAAAPPLSPDEQATRTEGDVRCNFDAQAAGNRFAPIDGYIIVKSGPTDFWHHGFYVVDEPYKTMKAAHHREEYAQPAGPQIGARIPGEVVPGETPPDIASMSLIQPTPEELRIKSSVDASYPDLRHLGRGGPQAASR